MTGTGTADRRSGGDAQKPSEPNLLVIGLALGILLLVVGALVVFFANRPNQGLADAAAIIAAVTFGAVAIERAIELVWSVIARSRNAWWPLNRIYEHVATLEANTNKAVAPTFDRAEELLGRARDVADDDRKAEIDAALTWLRERKTQLESQRGVLQSLTKDNQQIQLLSANAWQAIAEVDAMCTRYAPVLKETIDAANQVIVGATDFIATFKDNPTRRIMSLVMGATLGMATAGLVGLDIFAAINETTVAAPFFGVLVTGLVMGLGSSPTHEVIRVLQEAKKSRQTRNIAAPEAGGGVPDPTALILSLFTGARAAEAGAGVAPSDDSESTDRIPSRPMGGPAEPSAAETERRAPRAATVVTGRRPSSFSLDRRS